MPVVVLKVLLDGQKVYESERDVYLALDKSSSSAPSELSASLLFPTMISHRQFTRMSRTIRDLRWYMIKENHDEREMKICYFILQYLGPTLHDILENSYYTRFTAKMTMAVAIQLVSILCYSFNYTFNGNAIPPIASCSPNHSLTKYHSQWC